MVQSMYNVLHVRDSTLHYPYDIKGSGDMRQYTHLRGVHFAGFLLGFDVCDVDGCGEALGAVAFFLSMHLLALLALCRPNRMAGGEECDRGVLPSVLLH